jgi:hypothetical protein
MVPLSKRTIRLSGTIDPNGQLQVVLPSDIPPGPVELEITLPAGEPGLSWQEQLTILKARAEANGYADRIHFPTPSATPLPSFEPIELPPGARPSHELIDEDREDRV